MPDKETIRHLRGLIETERPNAGKLLSRMVISEANGIEETKETKEYRKKLEITEIRVAAGLLREALAGETDVLTGIYNLKGFNRELEIAADSSKRYGVSYMLVVLDANDLKRINDLAGHPAGDLYLRKIAGILESQNRKGSVVARPGGDEFAVILDHANEENVLGWWGRVNDIFLKEEVSISAGAIKLDPNNIRQTKEFADSLMYYAKAASKGNLESLTSPESQVLKKLKTLEGYTRFDPEGSLNRNLLSIGWTDQALSNGNKKGRERRSLLSRFIGNLK